MSYYYSYYAGYKYDGKIYPLGPFNCFGKLRAIVEKSRSFASDLHNDFYDVPDDAASDELRERFEYEDWKKKVYSCRYRDACISLLCR